MDVKNLTITTEPEESKFQRLRGKEYEDFTVQDIQSTTDQDRIFLTLSTKGEEIKDILNSRDDSLMESISMDEFLGQDKPDSILSLVSDIFK